MEFSSLVASFGSASWAFVFFVVALAIIIPIHELGHYLVGRWCGIGAEVFSFGFGPVLASRTDRRGTRWQIAAIPFGGYVRFTGDADAASSPDEAALAAAGEAERRRSLHGAPLWAHAATVAAGPVFNFVLSFFIFAGVMMASGTQAIPIVVDSVHAMPGEGEGQGLRPGDVILAIDGRDATDPQTLSEVLRELPDAPALAYEVRRDGRKITVEAPNFFAPIIGSVIPGSAAQDARLRPGDVVLAVNGEHIGAFRELQERTRTSGGGPLVLAIWRDGATSDITLTPREMDLPTGGGAFEKRYLIGLTSGALVEGETETPGIGAALGYGGTQTWEVVVTTLSGIWHMLTGEISTCNIQGPIGIAEVSGDAAAAGVGSFMLFVAFLSAAIGLMNLLPIPVLDGGHLVLMGWEAVTGRAPAGRALNVVMVIGLIVVLGLMAFGISNDLRCP